MHACVAAMARLCVCVVLLVRMCGMSGVYVWHDFFVHVLSHAQRPLQRCNTTCNTHCNTHCITLCAALSTHTKNVTPHMARAYGCHILCICVVWLLCNNWHHTTYWHHTHHTHHTYTQEKTRICTSAL